MAPELNAAFIHAVRHAGQEAITYRIPAGLREVRGKRVAVVDDVINAGSAVRGTAAEVRASAGAVVVIAALLVLGDAADSFATAQGVPVVTLSRRPVGLWEAAACPLCVPVMRLLRSHHSRLLKKRQDVRAPHRDALLPARETAVTLLRHRAERRVHL